MIEVGRECPMCRDYWTKEFDISAEQLHKLNTRADLIQNIFPNLLPKERDFLKTGCCYSCQELLFG